MNPQDPQDIAKGISNVLQSKKLANELVKKGRDRLKEFSWNKTALETYEIYKKVNS